MKNTLFYFLLFFGCMQTYAQQPEDYFITTWHRPWGEIVIPTNPAYVYDYTVDWGDGTVTTGHTGDASYNYGGVVGVYTVKISGDFPQFYNNGTYNNKLKSVEQWGTIQWKSMARSFKNVQGMAINTIDNPDLSQVTDMSEMFYLCGDFNGNLSGWDVSNVTNMNGMFFQNVLFNQDLGSWDVSNVTNMAQMFERTAFNQDIGNWDVSNVTTMEKMFSENEVFNQDIGRWNINNVTTMSSMFNGNAAALSPANYDALLTGWSTLALPNIIDFNQPLLKYCNAGAARTAMINKGWIFNDGGQGCNAGCSNGAKTWNGTVWTGGTPPTQTHKAIINGNYNTAISGNIDACSIQINPGFTLTVAPSTTIKVQRDLAINGNLVFESDATGNGELGKLGPKAAIIGEATVQRYMMGKRSYRMVSPTVNTSSSIMNNWQEGVHNTSTLFSDNQNPNPGFGTHITGSQTGANGFDATLTGNPSMYTVNLANQQFQIVENTDENKLRVGEAFLMMVRGDRSIDLANNASFGETTLRAKGKLIWGKKLLKYVSPEAGAFVMFGNPYQSAVDIKTVLATSTNVNRNHYYIYDPSIGANGAYVTVGLTNPPVNSVPSAANNYIQPGQGAQLETLAAGSVTLDFLESDKVPGQFTSTNATGNTVVEDGILRAKLYTQENFNNNGPVHDGFAILFSEENSNLLTSQDAVKPFNFYENLGIDHDGTYLSIEKRALPIAGETISLYTNGYSATEYVLEIDLNGFEDVTFYLDDHFTETSTVLETGANSYSFVIDGTNAESKATDRFSIRVAERLGVENHEMFSGLTLYPNPMAREFTIGNPESVRLDAASIYDITGRLIKSFDLKGTSSEVVLDVSNLSRATYMVVINSENGKMSKLMVKE